MRRTTCIAVGALGVGARRRGVAQADLRGIMAVYEGATMPRALVDAVLRVRVSRT